MRAYCVSVSSIQQRYHDPPNSVNMPRPQVHLLLGKLRNVRSAPDR